MSNASTRHEANHGCSLSETREYTNIMVVRVSQQLLQEWSMNTRSDPLDRAVHTSEPPIIVSLQLSGKPQASQHGRLPPP